MISHDLAQRILLHLQVPPACNWADRLDALLRPIEKSLNRPRAPFPEQPLMAGDALPSTDPFADRWPRFPGPWPGEASPIPFVVLPPGEVRHLAALAVFAQVRGLDDSAILEGVLAGRLARMPFERPLDPSTCVGFLRRWISSGRPLEVLRNPFPREVPGLLDREEALLYRRCPLPHRNLRAPLDPFAAEDLAKLPRWLFLVERGCDPTAVWEPPDVPPELPHPTESGTALRSVSVEDARDAALGLLLKRHPFFGNLLGRIKILARDDIDTMCVTTRPECVELAYNPRFLCGIGCDEAAGVLAHEIHHIIFEHLREPPRAPYPAALRRDAWMIACEVTANEYVGFPLPGRPWLLEHFRLPGGRSTATRYDELLRRYERDPSQARSIARRIASTLPTRSPDGAKPSEVLFDRALVNELDGQSRHVASSDGAAVLEAISVALGTRGSYTRRALEAALRGAELDWRIWVRRLLRNRPTSRLTYGYPSRRSPELLGVVPGRRRHREPTRLLVALDTSGSMGDSILRRILPEIRALLQLGCRIAFVQCDDQLREDRWLALPLDHIEVRGGGGTDLRPPFAPRVLQRYRPDAMIYFTDGLGEAPREAPPGLPVLWALTDETVDRPAPFGDVARVVAPEISEQ